MDEDISNATSPDPTQGDAAKALENLRMRLLDLTARNRLINFRHTKKGSLRVIDELPDQLVETLLADRPMRFLPIPEPTEEQLIDAGYIEIDESTGEEVRLKKDPTAEEWAKQLSLSTSYDVPAPSSTNRDEKHADTAIQTLLYPYELEARLKSLLQTAQSAIEEMGANILYLSFGFLEWYDANNDNARIAPLFLVPISLQKGRLNRQTGTYEYELRYSGEDLIPNLSLREKLRADFALALPELDEETTPEGYFKLVQELIDENQPRWRVRRFISVALLNFSKLLMYLDLDPVRWPTDTSILNHRVVSRFLGGYDTANGDAGPSDDFGFGEEHPIDEIADIHDKYPLIDDADSSQHSALIDAVDGQDLVIEGPPGTGKSQTITNLIAASLSQGKKVLFVAEKLAALEVVRRRLDAVGLGEFCLELHSHKSQKRKVLDEVDERIKKHGDYRLPREIAADIQRYEELKTQLKDHAERINCPWKNTGKTLHDIFMAATRYREAVDVNLDTIAPVGYDGDVYDATAQRRTADQVKAYQKVFKAVAAQLDGQTDLARHPWYGVRNADLQIFDLDRVTIDLSDWQSALAELQAQRGAVAKGLGCEPGQIPDSISGLKKSHEDLNRIPTLAGDELLDRLPVLRGDFLVSVGRFLKLFEGIQASYASLSEVVDHEVLRDFSRVDEIVGASKRLQWVTPGTDLDTLVAAVKKLEAISDELVVLEEPIASIQTAVGEAPARFLNATESGLSELATFIELVASLTASHWKQRDELFDNDELDELLPKLRRQLEQLQAGRDTIATAYDPERLPNAEELRRLAETLGDGGLFSWFSGSWRAARKQLLRLAANPQVKYANLHSLLGEAAAFIEQHDAFNTNTSYQDALGDWIKGLDTDIASIEALRHWYRQIRHEYGVGFGKKVVLGNAILNLPADIARAVRSLADRDAPKQLHALVDDLKQLKPVFGPLKALKSDDTQLSGNEGLIKKLLSSLDATLRACAPITSDANVSIQQLIERIHKLQSLTKTVAAWEKSHFDEKVFQGRLGLSVGLDADNTAGLATLKHTLGLAAAIDGDLTTEEIRELIYAHPETATFQLLRDLAARLGTAIDTQQQRFAAFEETMRLEADDWMRHCGDRIGPLRARNGVALEHPDALQNWLDYVRVRDQLEDMGLVALAEHIEQGTIDIKAAETAHKASLFDLLAREILREQPELGRFSGPSQEAIQEQFAQYDNRLKRLQSERIAYEVDQHPVPGGSPGPRAGDRTDLHLLKHECSKQKRHIPIRQLVHRAGNALAALKPCFMMGPMSVAQYLAPGQIEFDVVVMDEASQIKPQDALGAIARGAQIVVVGDPKQLPPTSFFDRVVDDEDDEDPTGIEESESILDATLPMFLARRLRWHYRSQHESLIAFSNHSFYDSDLVLFPSPHTKTDNHGIQYSRLSRGCFVNRRNMEEAKVISEAVREHFRHRPDESLGVVAMSAEQREQIERAIETLAKEDPVFQEWLEADASRQEALFVKNLENVQGDERDVIFISMTYGPQEPSGRVYQRFGPINSDVGWRRLNVLFTRSKKRMHIFSSMGSDDIVAGSTSKRGVQALRDFLAYCETGNLHTTQRDTGRGPDSDFEIAVTAALRDAGFECIPQVGVAGFFIDVAVVDPGNPGRYLMGIECDGATYHSAKSVRDRDRLRQTILERLGWKIRRIWSTDWFKNPHAELQPIIRELHELKSVPAPDEVAETQSEKEAIEEIVQEVGKQEAAVEGFAYDGASLKDRLMHFDREVIRKALPETPDNMRLLRPAMTEALREYMPTSKSEFLEMIPSYLRKATEADEGRYLDQVFEIINASIENWDTAEESTHAN